MEYAKFLHLLGLMLGAGAGFASMIVARQIRRSAGEPTTQLAALRPALARMALGGVLLLWLSGLWLYLGYYSGTNLGWAFHAKLGVAALLLLIAAAIPFVNARSRSRGVAPPAWLPILGMSTSILTLLAVGLAVYVFR